MADVCHTVGAGRTHFTHRAAVVGATREETREGLKAFQEEKRSKRVYKGIGKGRPRVAFLYTGQGAQYVGMGRGLYETQPVFREALERCDGILRGPLGRSLIELLYGKEAREEKSARPAFPLQRSKTPPAVMRLPLRCYGGSMP